MIRDVARPAFEAALSRKETIKKGFEMTGLCPFNPSAANRDKLKAGNIFQSSSGSTQSTPEAVEMLAEIVTSPVPDIPPTNSVLLASTKSNSPAPAEVEIEIYQEETPAPSGVEVDSSDVETVLPPTLSTTEGNPDQSVLSVTPPEFTTLPAMTLEDRIHKLERFQLVMLEPKQTAEFEKHFKAGVRFESSNFLWLSWLPLKLSTLRSEKEVFDEFLRAKIPNNIPKRVTTRRVNQPVGPDRIDPTSDAYMELFKKRQEDEKVKEEKKKENAQKRQEREILKNMKKEKVEQKRTAKEKVTEPEKKDVEEKRTAKEKVKEPAKKRGRPRKVAEENPPEESLEEVFSKLRKKRKS